MEDSTSNQIQSDLWRQTEFAALCSFFNKFGSALGFKPYSFPKLESLFVVDGEGNATTDLIDLHVRLMRKLGLKVQTDKWENGLLRFLSWQSWLQKEFLQVERFGYGHSPLSMRLCILKNLCDRQFDLNLKFKEQVSAQEVADLRVLPVGSDRVGQIYWYQVDGENNIRVYCEEPDDKSGSTWTIKAKNRDDVQALITSLRGDFEKEPTKPLKDQSNKSDDPPVKGEPKSDEKTTTEEPKQAVAEKNVKIEKEEKGSEDEPFSIAEPSETPKESETKEKADENGEVTLGNGDLSAENIKSEAVDEAEKPTEAKQEAEPPKAPNEKKPLPFGKSKKGSFLDSFQPSLKPVPEKKSKSKPQGTSNTENLKTEDDKVPESNEASMDETSQTGIPDASALSEIPPELLTPSRRVMPDRRAKLKALAAATPPSSAKKVKMKTPVDSSASSDSEAGSCPKVSDVESEEEEQDSEFEHVEHSDLSDDEYRAPRPRNSNNGTPKRTRKTKGSDDEERTPKKKKKAEPSTYCEKCGKKTSPEQLLLCDMCDDAWHTWCLNPSLWYIPDEDWFCPVCQEKMLVEKLTMALETLDEALAKQKALSSNRVRQDELLKRELEYVGITINNIIEDGEESPKKVRGARKRKEVAGEDENLDDEEDLETSSKENSGTESDPNYEDEEDERRREKRRKIKEMRRKRRERKRARYESPPPPIAMSRTRREVKHIDYSFKEFDTMIEEAMEPADAVGYIKPSRPSGIGRGKDMANIMEAAEIEEQKQRGETGVPEGAENKNPEEAGKSEEDDDPVARRARPPASHMPEGSTVTAAARRMSQKKHRHKLTDLDVDNLTESDEEEYKESGGSEYEEPSEPSNSDSDYEEVRPSRKSARLRGRNARTQSDDDFVVSGSDDSDSPKKRKPPPRRSRRRDSDDSEDSDSDASDKRRRRRNKKDSSDDSSGSEYGKRKRKPASRKKGSKKKSVIIEGRRTRGRRVNYKAFEDEDEDEAVKEEEGEKNIPASPVEGARAPSAVSTSSRSASANRMRGMPPTAPVGGKRKKKGDDSDSDAYKPDPSDEESEESEIDQDSTVKNSKKGEDSEEESDRESEEREDEEIPKKTSKKKRVVESEESSEEADDGAKESGSEEKDEDKEDATPEKEKVPTPEGEPEDQNSEEAPESGKPEKDQVEKEEAKVEVPKTTEANQPHIAAPATPSVDLPVSEPGPVPAINHPSSAVVTSAMLPSQTPHNSVPPAGDAPRNTSIAALETMINRNSPKPKETPEQPQSPAPAPVSPANMAYLQVMKPASPLVANLQQVSSAFAPPSYSTTPAHHVPSPPGSAPRTTAYHPGYASPITHSHMNQHQPPPPNSTAPLQHGQSTTVLHKPIPYHHGQLPPLSYAGSTQPPPYTTTAPIMSSAFAPPPQKTPFVPMTIYQPQLQPGVTHPSLVPSPMHHGIIPPPSPYQAVPQRYPQGPYPPRYSVDPHLGTPVSAVNSLTSASGAAGQQQSESLTDVLSFAIENN